MPTARLSSEYAVHSFLDSSKSFAAPNASCATSIMPPQALYSRSLEMTTGMPRRLSSASACIALWYTICCAGVPLVLSRWLVMFSTLM